MSREHLDQWCERGILALVLAILVFGPLATGAVRTPDFLVIQGLTIFAAGLWALRLWLSPQPQLLWPPLCWAVLSFAGYAVGRYFTADIEYLARQELIRVLVYALVLFIVLNNLHRQETVQIIAFTLIFLAVAISFYAVWQFLTGSKQVWMFITPYNHRGTGTYINPNHLAGFLGMLLPLTLAYAIAGRLKLPVKLLLGYAALVLAAGLAVTLSRGGWLAGGGALLVFFGGLLWRGKFRWPALLTALALLAAVGFFAKNSPYIQMRWQKTFGQNVQIKGAENLRFELWRPAIRIWRDNFWWGAGPAHFDARFPALRPQNVQQRPDHVHNDYLELLADWGVAGAALVAGALALFVLGVARTWRAVRGGDSKKFARVFGATCGLIALLLHSVVDFNLHIPANALLAVALLALASGHLRFATERYWVTAGWPLKSAASFALLAAMIYLGAQGWQRANEYVHLQRASRAPDYSPAQIAELKRALATEPNNFETTYELGEACRVGSMDGNWNYAAQAQQAIAWYERGMVLNPYNAFNWMRRGMCRDWLGQHDAAAADFARADRLDPNGHFVAVYVGWHYVQVEDYAAARTWFERSLRLEEPRNPLARKYLGIVERKLLENAAPR